MGEVKKIISKMIAQYGKDWVLQDNGFDTSI